MKTDSVQCFECSRWSININFFSFCPYVICTLPSNTGPLSLFMWRLPFLFNFCTCCGQEEMHTTFLIPTSWYPCIATLPPLSNSLCDAHATYSTIFPFGLWYLVSSKPLSPFSKSFRLVPGLLHSSSVIILENSSVQHGHFRGFFLPSTLITSAPFKLPPHMSTFLSARTPALKS